MKRAKMVVLGQYGSGKTSLVGRWKTGAFPVHAPTTIGADFCVLSCGRGDFVVELWDTSGEERFESQTRLYTQDAQVAVVVCDARAVRTHGWHRAVRHYVDLVDDRRFVSGHTWVFLNKRDELPPDSRLPAMPSDLRARVDGVLEVSAKSGDGVEAAWDAIVSALALDGRVCGGMRTPVTPASMSHVRLLHAGSTRATARPRCCGPCECAAM